ncbi:MAG: hypothetical protein HC860_07365 [Alkalinema sp. RU_4_3]|nr:hypothetical protein [Alkalinema sp. RU_4_3]
MTHFLPNQIVCLTHDSVYLYAEIIQHVTQRACCWARPLAIATAIDPGANPQDIGGSGWTWQDLRETSDLLLPDRLFREAMDTEVLPLMVRLYQTEDKPQEMLSPRPKQQLHQFIHQLYQAYPEYFVKNEQ